MKVLTIKKIGLQKWAWDAYLSLETTQPAHPRFESASVKYSVFFAADLNKSLKLGTSKKMILVACFFVCIFELNYDNDKTYQ